MEEERFTRKKHAKAARVDNPDEIPLASISYCLKKAGINLSDVSYIGFSFNPEKRLENARYVEEVVDGDWGSEKGERIFHSKIMHIPERLSELAGQNMLKKFRWIDHHLCHAASVYLVSPYADAAILSVDGIGETTSTLLSYGNGTKMHIVKEIEYPNSLGFLWEKISKFLGFSEYDACKIMGLASYGDSNRYRKQFGDIVKFEKEGGFRIDNSILKFRVEEYSALEKLFGKRRQPQEPLTKRHRDIAASLQGTTNRIALHLSRYLYKRTKSKNLCIAGGVGLNCTTNRVLSESSMFDNIFIQPASNDAGTSMGAAFYLWNMMLGKPRTYVLESPYLGPEFTAREVKSALEKRGLCYQQKKDIAKVAAKLVSEGNIVAWFQGGMEYGPRALGNRSLIADPRRRDMRGILNRKVKHRENFRPYAPSVLSKKAKEWFYINQPSPASDFMLFSYKVRENKVNKIPAVVHVDYTSRIQTVRSRINPRYYCLIREFEKITGVPIVLNTSFNDSEPIVCTPEDAINTFMKTKIDYLVLEDFLVSKRQNQKA